MAEDIMNLEDFAEESETENTTENTHNSDTEKTKKNNESDSLETEMNTLFKFPFEVAMQNLKVNKEEIIEAGRQIFEKGYYEVEIKLPFNNSFVLRTSKAVDDLDYYAFVSDAIKKDMNIQEFNYMLNIRNMAKALQSFQGKDYSKESIDKKIDMLLSLSAPLIKSMLEASKGFWSILMLTMHPEFVGFLMSETQA
jgi:hypothetical protein